MDGTRNLWASKRTKFVKCRYWIQNNNERLVPNEILAHNRICDGYFDAEEINSYYNGKQVIQGVFNFDTMSVVIKTNDDVKKLKAGDIVLLDTYDEAWFVEDVQQVPMKRGRQFCNNLAPIETIISLRK